MKTYFPARLAHIAWSFFVLTQQGKTDSDVNGYDVVGKAGKQFCLLPSDHCEDGFNSSVKAVECDFGDILQSASYANIDACPTPPWYRQWVYYPYRFDLVLGDSSPEGNSSGGVFAESRCNPKAGPGGGAPPPPTFPDIAAMIRSPAHVTTISGCHTYRLEFWMKLASQPVLAFATEDKYALQVYVDPDPVRPPDQLIWGDAEDYGDFQEGLWTKVVSDFTVDTVSLTLIIVAYHPNRCVEPVSPISVDDISLAEGIPCSISSTTTSTTTTTTTTTTSPVTSSSSTTTSSTMSTSGAPTSDSSTISTESTTVSEQPVPPSSDSTTTSTVTTTETTTTATNSGPTTTTTQSTTTPDTTTASTMSTTTTSATAPPLPCGDGGTYDEDESQCRCSPGFIQDGSRRPCRCRLSQFYSSEHKDCRDAPALLYAALVLDFKYTQDFSSRDSDAFQRFASDLKERLRDFLLKDLIGVPQNEPNAREYEPEIWTLREGSVVADVILRIETESSERHRLIVDSWQRLDLSQFQISGIPTRVTSKVTGHFDRCQDVEGAAVRCGSGAYCRSSSTNETTSCECNSGLVKLAHSDSCGPPLGGLPTEIIIAIVGGVVGGLVLVAFITLFALKRRISRRPPPEPRRNSRATVASQSSRPLSEFQDARSRNRSQISSNYALTVYPASNISRGRPPIEEQPDYDDEAESSATSGYPESNRSLSFSSTY